MHTSFKAVVLSALVSTIKLISFRTTRESSSFLRYRTAAPCAPAGCQGKILFTRPGYDQDFNPTLSNSLQFLKRSHCLLGLSTPFLQLFPIKIQHANPCRPVEGRQGRGVEEEMRGSKREEGRRGGGRGVKIPGQKLPTTNEPTLFPPAHSLSYKHPGCHWMQTQKHQAVSSSVAAAALLRGSVPQGNGGSQCVCTGSLAPGRRR